MESLLQPTHLFFILLIVLILFGPGKVSDIGKGLGHAASDLRGVFNGLHGALFMAKGVDPAVGRDVGDMLPDEDAGRKRTWFIYLLAILIGNTLYLFLSPFLPATAQLEAGFTSPLPVLVDLWFCFLVFGVLNLAVFMSRRSKPKSR